MITFDAEFKVLEKEKRSVPRRDGNGTFDFEEIKLETTDKKPTVIVARSATQDMVIEPGTKAKMKICINSNASTNGRVFYNFVILSFQVTEGKKEDPVTPFELDDELPF